MSKGEKESFHKKENFEKKRFIKYKKEISSTRLTKIILKFLLIIIFYNSISLTDETSLGKRILETSSKITMIMNGPGQKKIFGTDFNFGNGIEYTVIINDVQEPSLSDNGGYQLGKDENNNVTLIIQSPISSCANMFKNVKDLIEIDLSEFDSSSVADMNSMFFGCSNLKKINISNFDTSKVKTIDSMFEGCSSLRLLDISNWNTSSVISAGNMFSDCDDLLFLDTSNTTIIGLTYIYIFKKWQSLKFDYII